MLDLNEWFEKHNPTASQEARDDLADFLEEEKSREYDDGYDRGLDDGEQRALENYVEPEPADLGIVIDYAGRILHNGNHVGWLNKDSSDMREFVADLGAVLPMWTGEFIKLEERK